MFQATINVNDKNYISYSIPVPIGVLLEALKENISFTQSK